jgi:hypothetical protein
MEPLISGLGLEDSHHLDDKQKRICFKMKSCIRIRIRVMRIRNLAPKNELLLLYYDFLLKLYSF